MIIRKFAAKTLPQILLFHTFMLILTHNVKRGVVIDKSSQTIISFNC